MDLRASPAGRGTLRGLRASFLLLCTLGTVGVWPAELFGQDASQGDGAAHASPAEVPGPSDDGFRLLGRPPGQTRAIGGIWSLHPYAISFPRIEETFGYGVQWRGWFAATFVNSYGDRSVTAGVERVWGELDRGPFAVGIGYRAGLITGYDERLLSWADDVPALPLLGLQGWIGAGPLRFDAFYVYRVITLEGSIRLSW